MTNEAATAPEANNLLVNPEEMLKKATKKASSKKAAKPASKKASKAAAPKKEANASKKAAKPVSKPAAKKETKASVPREFSKKAVVLDLLRRKDGATMAEIAKATDWQNHSIRGFISGQLTKRMGLTVESAKNEAGERTYRISK